MTKEGLTKLLLWIGGIVLGALLTGTGYLVIKVISLSSDIATLQERSKSCETLTTNFAETSTAISSIRSEISSIREQLKEIASIRQEISSIRQEISSISREISFIQGTVNIPHGSKTAFGKVSFIDHTKGILVIRETSGKSIELKFGKEIGVAVQTVQGISPASLLNITQETSIRVDYIEDPQTSVKEARAILIYKK